MRYLNVIYDPQCDEQTRVLRWAQDQPSHVRLLMISADDPSLPQQIPGLDAASPAATALDVPRRALRAVSSDGCVYRGAKAWSVLAWAIRSTRSRSLHMAARGTPGLVRATLCARAEAHGILSPLPGTVIPATSTRPETMESANDVW